MSVALNTKHLSSFISEEEYAAIYPQVEAAHNQLEAKSGPGNDFLGWMYLPRDYDKEEFARIKEAAAKIREDSDVLVVAGIGGSYLGARAVIEAVKGQFHNELENGPKIYFCGNSISPTYLNNIISLCKGKRFSINVISKSGTTTETSLAFRVLRELLEKEMGVEEANKRIYATTDRAKGTLKQLADAQGWPTFVVPDDVGGRYSVLSAVGLLPIAAAGISIDDLMKGAADSMERFSVLSKDNDAYKYAAIRNAMMDMVRDAFAAFEQRMVTEDKDGICYQRVSLDEVLPGEEQLRRIEAIADPYAMQPQSIMEEQESRRELYDGLKRLTQREQTYLLYRYGFTDGEEHPLIGTAIYFRLTKGRAKKTEEQAMDNLWLELPWWFI